MAKPILKYFGAKWSAAARIVPMLPRMARYVEPYCGSAAIYLNLPWQPYHAILNDLNGDIVNLFRVIREQPKRLMRAVSLTPYAEAEHAAAWDVDIQQSDAVERARLFLVRQWMNHGGVLSRAGFRHRGRSTSSSSTTSLWRDLPQRITDVIEPLRHAEILSRPAIDVITYYNNPDTLLVVDPPYPLSVRGGRKYYSHEMSDADHLQLIEALQSHTGPVALCGYRCDLYSQALDDEWKTVDFSATAEGGNTRTETVWLRNFDNHIIQRSFEGYEVLS